ncbi:MAG: hypothetical protein P4M11_06965 [Candidatus Pacebacteria bacterium]|nr:hypothetical protein [Candidatus Paceibacterota bacterium]
MEYYKEYEKKVDSYKSLNQVSALVEKIEFIVKKAKNLILTQILEEDKVSFEKLEESLKYLRELGSSNVLIMPLLQERKNRLVLKINEVFQSAMANLPGASGKLRTSQNLTLSINLLKNKEQNEGGDDVIVREKVKQCIDVADPVDGFVSYSVGKRSASLDYKIDETYAASLTTLGKELVDEMKIINQIAQIYTSKASDRKEDDISTMKILSEIVIYLCTTIDKIFLKQVTKEPMYDALNKSISVIQQITRMTVFPQESLLFGDKSFPIAIFLADIEHQLQDVLPATLLEKIGELTSKFAQAYVNRSFFDVYTTMDKLDLKTDQTLATLAYNEEPLFMNEFKAMVYEGLEDIAKFLDRIHKSMVNSKPILSALKMPLQNIIIHLLVLVYKEANDLVSRVRQLLVIANPRNFEFDESVPLVPNSLIAQAPASIRDGPGTAQGLRPERACVQVPRLLQRIHNNGEHGIREDAGPDEKSGGNVVQEHIREARQVYRRPPLPVRQPPLRDARQIRTTAGAGGFRAGGEERCREEECEPVSV